MGKDYNGGGGRDRSFTLELWNEGDETRIKGFKLTGPSAPQLIPTLNTGKKSSSVWLGPYSGHWKPLFEQSNRANGRKGKKISK